MDFDYKSIIIILMLIILAIIFTLFYRYFTKGIVKEIINSKSDIEIIDEYLYENQPHIKKRRKIFRTIKSIGFYGLTFIIMTIFIISLINKFQGNLTMINDRGVLVVATGSMSYKHEANNYLEINNLDNQFNAYDIIVISNIDSEEELQLYDVVVFQNPDGKLIIHRIVEINEIDGETIYTTRGDANDSDDAFKSTINEIKGKYIDKKIPFVGLFILFLQSVVGISTIIILLYCYFMIDKYQNVMVNAKNKRLEVFSFFEYSSEEKFDETIYYRGFIYKFDENGFIDKFENIESLYNANNYTATRVIVLKESNEEIIDEYVLGEVC